MMIIKKSAVSAVNAMYGITDEFGLIVLKKFRFKTIDRTILAKNLKNVLEK
jgi:hypothetical protein